LIFRFLTEIKKKMNNKQKIIYPLIGILIILNFYLAFSVISGTGKNRNAIADTLSLDDQEATIRAIERVRPAVASIIVYDWMNIQKLDMNTGERATERVRSEKGQGTGFIISPDGLILTNKHVANAADKTTGEYRIILNSGKEYYAQYIGVDPVFDLAILKIFDKNLPTVELGDSSKLKVGSTVVAIGNALGQYRNSATKGIVSGLGRSISASDKSGANSESLDNVIQTDAEINPGNSGGPLIDLLGRVVGINTAIDESGASIGFAIPINDTRPAIASVKQSGRIIRPRFGVRYLMLTTELARDNKLPRNSGAWIVKGDGGEQAIAQDSPAERAGLIEGDIIFEINAIKLEGANSLLSVVQRYKPGQKVGVKIRRGSQTLTLTVTLDEFR
jgi:serine protease Do